MSSISEQVAREHWAYRWHQMVRCKGCGRSAKAPHLLAAEDWWRLHVAAVTERLTREQVLAAVVTPEAREHWEWTQRDRQRSRSGRQGCTCALCGVMARIEQEGAGQ